MHAGQGAHLYWHLGHHGQRGKGSVRLNGLKRKAMRFPYLFELFIVFDVFVLGWP